MFEWEKTVFGYPYGRVYKKTLWGMLDGSWYVINTSPTKVPEDYPITPDLLERPTGGDGVGLFGKFEIEILAAAIVKFAQKKGNWGDFTQEEFARFSHSAGYNYNFSFMLGAGWLLENSPRSYSITLGFVNEIYEKQVYEERLMQFHRRERGL